jgi:hypothetical protein
MWVRRAAVGVAAIVVAVILLWAWDGPQPSEPRAGSGPTGASPTATATPTASPTPAASAPSDTSGDGSAIVAGSVDRTSFDLTATYDADLRIGWADGTIGVEETIEVTNTSGGPIDRLELNTVAARLGRMRGLAARVDGTAVQPAIDDQTVVLPLGGVLGDGASATVEVGFRATLRSTTSGSSWLFTKANGIVDLYRWLPWVSVRTAFDRPNFGDPFVTPSSPRVTVRITADRQLSYATSGVLTASEGRTKTFTATNVRDFAITAAADYGTTSGSIDGIRIDVMTRPGAPASTLLARARRALHDQAGLVGAYPYPTLTVAESAGGYGMEAPAAIWIPRGTEASRIPYLVSHETAHQWFYGVVGNDEAREPWTDEAAADFLARYVLGQRRASACSARRLDRSIYDYSSACYYEVVYIQGGNLIDDVRRRIGNDRFWPALRRYVAAHRFGVVHERTLLDALDAATPLDLRATMFERRFPSRY